MTNAPEGEVPAGAHGSSPEPVRLSAGAPTGKRSGSPRPPPRSPYMQHPTEPRPDNREVENEQAKNHPSPDGPPRPATEPEGAKESVQNPHTETDPGTGEQKS